mgnify:CR=1 FL=1
MSEQKNIRIGDVLKEYGYVTEEQLQQALEYQKDHRDIRLGRILTDLGIVTEKQMLQALAKRLSLPLIDLKNCDFHMQAVERIPRQLAIRNHIIAFDLTDTGLKAVTSDPLNLYGMEEVRQAAGINLELYLAEVGPIDEAIKYYYSEVDARQAAKSANDTAEVEEIADLTADEGEGDAPIIKLVQSLIIRGYNTGASDIHVEPFEDKTLVRMRIDGTLIDYLTLQAGIQPSVIARIKIMSNMDIAEKRLPQDGHFRTRIDGNNVNVRTSVIPTAFGEKAVMRILASKAAVDYASHFGMNDDAYQRFAPMLTSPNGIIYITGPTGSGKSTTLYMVLEAISGRNINISTIEDPVEKNVMRVNQMQVNAASGLTFDMGLRALLRQDPDVIMVGETRDAETASISVRAAITGHLVLSTLHTNDALSTVVRLRDMGVEPYMLANSLVGLVAQRLMRKVCPYCGKLVDTTPEEREFLGSDIAQVRKAVGCPQCNNTGYAGRIAIHEIACVDRGMRELIARSASAEELNDYAIRNQGMHTLKQSGTELVAAGITTMEELLKVAYHSL